MRNFLIVGVVSSISAYFNVYFNIFLFHHKIFFITLWLNQLYYYNPIKRSPLDLYLETKQTKNFENAYQSIDFDYLL